MCYAPSGERKMRCPYRDTSFKARTYDNFSILSLLFRCSSSFIPLILVRNNCHSWEAFALPPPSTKRKKRCPHCSLILSKDIRHFLDPFFISSLFFTLYCSLSILVCNNCHNWERVRFTFVSRRTLAGGNSVLIRFIVKRKSRSEHTVIRAA